MRRLSTVITTASSSTGTQLRPVVLAGVQTRQNAAPGLTHRFTIGGTK